MSAHRYTAGPASGEYRGYLAACWDGRVVIGRPWQDVWDDPWLARFRAVVQFGGDGWRWAWNTGGDRTLRGFACFVLGGYWLPGNVLVALSPLIANAISGRRSRLVWAIVYTATFWGAVAALFVIDLKLLPGGWLWLGSHGLACAGMWAGAAPRRAEHAA